MCAILTAVPAAVLKWSSEAKHKIFLLTLGQMEFCLLSV